MNLSLVVSSPVALLPGFECQLIFFGVIIWFLLLEYLEGLIHLSIDRLPVGLFAYLHLH